MSSRVGVLSDPTVALGFRLAGVEPTVAESVAEASEVLARMVDDDRIGVILVQQDLAPGGAPAATRRDRSGLPLVVLFPGPAVESPADDAVAYVTELLRRAVGYRVRLR